MRRTCSEETLNAEYERVLFPYAVLFLPTGREQQPLKPMLINLVLEIEE